MMNLPKNVYKFFLAALVITVLLIIPKNKDLSYGYSWENVPTPGPWRCTGSTPDQVILYQPNHPLLPKSTAAGEVRLNWLKVANADKYTLAFGVQPGVYIYGLPSVGNTDNYTVKFLNPGTSYYFVVRAVNGCMPGPWSQEWSAVAPGAGGSTGTSYTGSSQTGTGQSGVLPSPQTNYQQPRGGTQVIASPSPINGGYQPPTDGVQPRISFWQRIGNWFTNLFK